MLGALVCLLVVLLFCYLLSEVLFSFFVIVWLLSVGLCRCGGLCVGVLVDLVYWASFVCYLLVLAFVLIAVWVDLWLGVLVRCGGLLWCGFGGDCCGLLWF